MFKYVIGIDPGVRSGVFIFENGIPELASTLSVTSLISYIQSVDKCLIVIEDSRLQSYVFTGDKLNEQERLKIARNVGMVDLVCKMVEDAASCGLLNEVVKVSPHSKGKKIKTNKELEYLTGLTVPCTNQHERDAFKLAYIYRNAK